MHSIPPRSKAILKKILLLLLIATAAGTAAVPHHAAPFLLQVNNNFKAPYLISSPISGDCNGYGTSDQTNGRLPEGMARSHNNFNMNQDPIFMSFTFPQADWAEITASCSRCRGSKEIPRFGSCPVLLCDAGPVNVCSEFSGSRRITASLSSLSAEPGASDLSGSPSCYGGARKPADRPDAVDTPA